MNKKISSTLAISIISALAIISGAIILFVSFGIKTPMTATNSCKIAKSIKEDCKSHIYKGKSAIRVWKINDDEKMLVKVKKEDVAKLPSKSSDVIRLIDSDADIQEKLANSSEENPVEIKISGFANKCDVIFLASLEYSDEIFKPYL